MAYNNLVTENASLGHKSNRAMEAVNYNPVTGLTDKVPSVPLDKALSTTSTNPVENRAIAESVIECINGISRNRYAIEQATNEISNVNTRIDINVTAIEKNAQDIQTVNDKVAANTSAIEQNTINIQKNTDAIEQIDTDIGDLTEVITTVRRHSVEIVELKNTTDEQTNDIAENTSAIVHEATRASNAEQANTTAISDEVTRATAAEGALQTAMGNIPVVSANVSDTATETLSNIKVGNTVYGASTGGGVPLGTWVSFDDGITPDANYIEAGTVFDENVYPELYLHLGSNTVPERFDHNKLGDRQIINLNVSAANAPVMPYDGVVWVTCNPTTTNTSSLVLRINEQEIVRQSSSAGNQSSVYSPVKKGEKPRASTDNGAITSYVAYYTKKLYIKATPISAPIVIPSAEVQEIKGYTKNYVDAKGSYSTEEIDTGKLWIDGKKIYRKAGFYIGSTGTTEKVFDATLTISYVDCVISAFANGKNAAGTSLFIGGPYASSDVARLSLRCTSSGLCFMASTEAKNSVAWWIEYTKS